jgi:hypothetical protein
MAEQRRRSPEDDGLPDFDDRIRKLKLIEQDEDLPVPADRLLAAFDNVTAEDMRRGDSLRTRLARELPDVPSHHIERIVGRIVDEDTRDGEDVTGELVGTETDDTAALAPEEAAMHEVPEDR